MNTKQSGFAHIGLILLVVLIVIAAAVGLNNYNKHKSSSAIDKNNLSGNSGAPDITEANSAQIGQNSKVKIKHIGVNLDYYDPATNKAGDFTFSKAKFTSGIQSLFFEYGFVIPAADSSSGKDKVNPQPTFILPIGSKVYSLVDGEVVGTPKLYSNDYSVMVKGEGSELIFETEHVENVIVKVGDRVKAGQQVAEVSSYSKHGYDGQGLVEIGILRGGNPPYHVCPFDFLDDSIKSETIKKLNALKKSWEEYRGDTKIYDEANTAIPGCINRAIVEG
jgi:biotin carboxyl carrier protein